MHTPGIIDTHCHLFHERLLPDQAEVAARALGAGVAACVIPAVDVADARESCRLVERHSRAGWYGLSLGVAVGVHPHEVAAAEAAGGLPAALAELRALAAGEAVVAIGEIGLDLARGTDNYQQQARWLRAQLELAGELELPVILHTRDAAIEMGQTLRAWAAASDTPAPPGPRPAIAGVLHAFTGDLGLAALATELGFAVGVGGIATFSRETELRQLLARLPLECQVLETDAPYLSPHPHRGRRNEPARITSVADCLASARSQTRAEVVAATHANAIALFPRLARLR